MFRRLKTASKLHQNHFRNDEVYVYVCLCKNIIGHFGQQIFFYGIKLRNLQVLKGKVQGTNVPRLILSWERMFHGTNGPGNEMRGVGLEAG